MLLGPGDEKAISIKALEILVEYLLLINWEIGCMVDRDVGWVTLRLQNIIFACDSLIGTNIWLEKQNTKN